MRRIAIPTPALARLQAAYQQFDLLVQVVADTLEIPSDAPRQLDIQGGAFILEESPNGVTEVAEQHV